MKEVSELKFPDDLQYSTDHEWAATEGDVFKIGISDYAQDQLGDIVYVELPRPGTILEKGEEFGTVESVKAVSELYMPLSGEVAEANTELEESPELVNDDPYGGGWMIKIKPSDTSQVDELMDSKAYLSMIEE